MKGRRLKRKARRTEVLRHSPNRLPESAEDSGVISVQTGDVVGSKPPERTASTPGNPRTALSTLATLWWRAMNKAEMMATQDGQGPDMVRLVRYLTSMGESLKNLGIVVVDPVNQAYDPGMGLKVISFEARNGTSRDIISETLRPQVMWENQLIQLAEVIVTTFTETTAQEGQHGQDNN